MAKWRDGERDESNTGYAAYIGTKRIAWNLYFVDAAIREAVDYLRKLPTKNRFVPSVTIFDCARIVVVAHITDDGNGLMVRRCGDRWTEPTETTV